MTFEKITREDLPELTELYSRYLTEGEVLTENAYAAWDRGDGFGTKAVENGKIIGFFGLRRGLVFTYPHPELERELQEVIGDEEIYIVEGMLVLPEYRDRGIAHRLVAETMACIPHWSGCIVIEIWIYPDGSAPGKEPQETVGEIIYQKKVPMFYKDLKQYGMRCPVCGEHCVCGAWIDVARVRPRQKK